MPAMLRLTTLAVAILSATLVPFACTTVPGTKAERDALASAVESVIASTKAKDPSLEKFYKESYGYAIFPEVGNGGAGIAFSYGHGMLYQGGKAVGYCDLSKGTVGATLGGQAFQELIFFKDKERFDGFTLGKFVFAANASAVAVTAGGGASASYKDGVAVFIANPAGLMFDASIGGQQFNYRPMDSVAK
jgi:hypothetical protein